MYEVELKAWLDNKIKTEAKLRNFATFDALFFKQDTYYHLNSKNITVRIREEEIHSSNNITEKQILYQDETIAYFTGDTSSFA